MSQPPTLNVIQRSVMALIRAYQRTLSPDHGWFKSRYPYGYCRFSPTCSEYGYQSVEKYGTIKGGIRALWRIIRCNPWNPGGYDPVK